MGIVKRAADLAYTIRFVTLMSTPFESMDAYKLGIIDAEGKRRKEFEMNTMDNRKAYQEYFTPFHRLVFNVKRFLSNAPGGSSRIASYASALYLIREEYGISEEDIKRGLTEAGIDPTDLLTENNQWFVLEDQRLSPGIYRVTNPKCLNRTFDDMVRPFDKIRVEDKSYPIGEIFGLNIYEAIHMPTQQKIYVTAEEILK